MIIREVKYVIIGAGLSGLTSGYKLDKEGEDDFVLLESRDRIGGRILGKEGIDFGATWFQNHHTSVSQLLDLLGVKKFHQFQKGKSVLVYSSMAPAHYFESDQSVPSACRIEGGSKGLIDQLASTIQSKVSLDTKVTGISEENDRLIVETSIGVFKAEKVIITIPPRLATRIEYRPSLPEKVISIMENTHTWMSNAIKIGLTYQRPFWREKSFSGTIIGQMGAVTELYDHTSMNNSSFALMGFVNEALRDDSPVVREEKILSYISKYLGDEAMDYLTYEEKDWSLDNNTSSDQIKSIYLSPSYGNPVFQNSYMNNKLIFSGAETSPVNGGYMDGAIYAGMSTIERLLTNESNT